MINNCKVKIHSISPHGISEEQSRESGGVGGAVILRVNRKGYIEKVMSEQQSKEPKGTNRAGASVMSVSGAGGKKRSIWLVQEEPRERSWRLS